MNEPQLSEAELVHLAAEVERQLEVLRSASRPPVTFHRSAGDESPENLPPAPDQMEVIERATGESFESFWGKYCRHARRDLCLPGGMLNEQWRKWRDLESKAAVRVSYGWLAAMGVPAGSLAPVAVAASVFLLNVAVKIGIDAICEGCAEEVTNP
jgi:hypothetical protein